VSALQQAAPVGHARQIAGGVRSVWVTALFKGGTNMKYRILGIVGLLTVAGILCVGVATGVSKAHHRGFSNEDLCGMYSLQSTGAYVFPSTNPLSVMNGPYSAIGTVWADGKGNMKMNLTVNFNGKIYRSNDEASYRVHPDGTFTRTLVTPWGPGLATYTDDGVLVKNGEEVRYNTTGFSVTGIPIVLPTDYIGMVISGSMIRQDEGGNSNW